MLLDSRTCSKTRMNYSLSGKWNFAFLGNEILDKRFFSFSANELSLAINKLNFVTHIFLRLANNILIAGKEKFSWVHISFLVISKVLTSYLLQVLVDLVLLSIFYDTFYCLLHHVTKMSWVTLHFLVILTWIDITLRPNNGSLSLVYV